MSMDREMGRSIKNWKEQYWQYELKNEWDDF